MECRKWGFKRYGGLSASEDIRVQRPFPPFSDSQCLDFPGALRTLWKRAEKGWKRPILARFPGRAARHPSSPHLLHPHLRQPKLEEISPFFSFLVVSLRFSPHSQRALRSKKFNPDRKFQSWLEIFNPDRNFKRDRKFQSRSFYFQGPADVQKRARSKISSRASGHVIRVT